MAKVKAKEIITRRVLLDLSLREAVALARILNQSADDMLRLLDSDPHKGTVVEESASIWEALDTALWGGDGLDMAHQEIYHLSLPPQDEGD